MADSQKYGRTEQLLDKDNIVDGGAFYPDLFTNKMTASDNTVILLLPCKSNTTYTISRRNVITHRFSMCFLTSDEIYAGMPTYGSIGNDAGLTLASTSTAESRYLCFYYGKKGGSGSSTSEEIQAQLAEVMINEGPIAKSYQPYLKWQHSLRKLTTATEAVENPLYSDGTAITAYTLKGNTVQSGTPTPDTPVEVNGVGVRTENILLINNTAGVSGITATVTTDGNGVVINGTAEGVTRLPTLSSVYLETGTYTITGCPKNSGISIDIRESNSSVQIPQSSDTGNGAVFTIDTADNYRVCARVPQGTTVNNLTIYPMITEGTTIPESYEPYGYKIPISSGGVTTNIYLGSTQTVRQIKKLVLDGTENWQGSDTSPTKNLTLEGYAKISGISCVSTHYNPANNVDSGDPIPYDSCCFYIGASNVVYLKGNESSSYPKTIADFKAYLAQQYANGTPVTVWYVLATPETATVNEPLMQIGTYSDTLSNAASIPTTEGANSITVDTTVQPSEFTATWTGWHNANVEEWDGSDWQ